MIDPNSLLTENNEQIIDMRELGSTGLRRFSGFIYQEFLKELTGWKGVQTYTEMSKNDPTIASCLNAINLLCKRVSWNVKPASQSNRDIEAADFLTSCMNDMSLSWNEMITSILSFLTYGHDFEEVVYKRRCGDSINPSYRSQYVDGRIGWRKISTRSQDTLYRWIFDDHGGIQAVQQLAPPHYYYTVIPLEKALLFRTKTYQNNPEGESILRGAYRPWYFKKIIENIEAIGIERDLAGLPMALVPPEYLSSSATPQQKAILENIKQIVTNVKRDEQEGLVFPSKYDAQGKPLFEFKLLSTGGTRNFDTDKIIQRYDQRIAMTLMADFMLLGSNATGSYALSSDKTDLFTNAIGAYLDIIADTFNRFAIPRLFKLNPDLQISAYPTLEHGDIGKVNLKELCESLNLLSSAGMPLFPNNELENYLLNVAKLPTRNMEENDEELQVENKKETLGRPQKIIEIPDPGMQVPSSVDWQSDTSPVNGMLPPAKTFTNTLGSSTQGI